MSSELIYIYNAIETQKKNKNIGSNTSRSFAQLLGLHRRRTPCSDSVGIPVATLSSYLHQLRRPQQSSISIAVPIVFTFAAARRRCRRSSLFACFSSPSTSLLAISRLLRRICYRKYKQ